MAWNKGLTKDDPRVKKYTDKLAGRRFTVEWKKKISEAHKGKKLSESHARKISESLTGRKRTKEERQSIKKGMTGRVFSQETREKMRLAKIGKKLTHEHKTNIKNRWNPEMKKQASQRRSKQRIPLKHTSIERKIHSLLKENRIDFETSYPINLGFMIHQADIFISPNKIIELFGTYHHADPFRYSPDQIMRVKGHTKASDIWKSDYQIISMMKEKGYDVMVIWQSDLKNKLVQTEQKVLDFIKKRS